MPARSRILFDAFHHLPPGHRVGPHIVTGGYAVNVGRYAPGDCCHPNGLAHLQAALSDRFDFRLLTQPYSDLSLFDADVLLIANPDYPLYPGASPYRWTPADVDALLRFLDRGGGVLLAVNSFLSRPDYWEENFDLERVSLLFDRLGIRWDSNFMSASRETARAGKYRIAYGQGGRVHGGALPPGIEPLLVRDENIYGFRTRRGAGTLAVLGDAGMISNGLLCAPGYNNLAFILDLFRDLRPGWTQRGVTLWDCVGSRSLSAPAGNHACNETTLRALRPTATWMEDHHFRHLTWTTTDEQGVGRAVWKRAPIPLDQLGEKNSAPARLRWLRLDSDQPGPEFGMELTATHGRTRDGIEAHWIGRHVGSGLRWTDLCDHAPGRGEPATIGLASAVFELRAVLDAQGRPTRARWAMGQRLFMRNANTSSGGQEMILSSVSGAFVPRAAPADSKTSTSGETG